MLWNCPAYVEVLSVRWYSSWKKHFAISLALQLPVTSTFLSSPLASHEVPLFFSSQRTNCLLALAAWANALNLKEGEAVNRGYLCRLWHSLRCGPPPENLRLWLCCRTEMVKNKKAPSSEEEMKTDLCCQGQTSWPFISSCWFCLLFFWLTFGILGVRFPG